jgi:hypothetical protein
MKRTVRVLAAAAILGFSAVATSGSALADGARSGTGGLATPAYPCGLIGYCFYGKGPVYYGEYAPLAYDSYFAYEYPVYTGSDVTAIAVDLFNSRFRYRRVVGPGVVYYRGEYPHAYRVNRYW